MDAGGEARGAPFLEALVIGRAGKRLRTTGRPVRSFVPAANGHASTVPEASRDDSDWAIADLGPPSRATGHGRTSQQCAVEFTTGVRASEVKVHREIVSRLTAARCAGPEALLLYVGAQNLPSSMTDLNFRDRGLYSRPLSRQPFALRSAAERGHAYRPDPDRKGRFVAKLPDEKHRRRHASKQRHYRLQPDLADGKRRAREDAAAAGSDAAGTQARYSKGNSTRFRPCQSRRGIRRV